MVTCAFDECENEFEPSRPNQKYCSSDCTVRANNKRAMARYNRRKQLRASGGRRVCATPGCGTVLRKGNDSDYCGPCEKQAVLRELERIRRSILDS